MKKFVYDPDPIINEVRAVRAKMARKYPTIEAYCEHLRELPSTQELADRIGKKLARREKRKQKALLSRQLGDGMEKKKIYVETSVISYLTSRPARDLILLARQQLTADWWERRDEWELFVSPPVFDEASLGDTKAADRRMEIARTMTELPNLPAARKLANKLIATGAMPSVASTDAAHLSIAACHKIPFLLTWNQRHLDNPILRQKVMEVISEWGFPTPLVLTPERMLEVKP